MSSWAQYKVTAGIAGAIIAEAFSGVLGGWDAWLQTLVLFVVLDYISGIMAAAVQKKLNSEIGFRGIVKKVFIFILVAVAFKLDMLFGTDVIRIAVIGFYLGTEGLSILENAGKANLPLPEFLTKALQQLRELRGEDNKK